MFTEIIHRLCHLLDVEFLRPVDIAGTFTLVHFSLNVNEQ